MDTSQGWICLHRKFLDWGWFTDIATSHLFLYLILKANHKDRNHKGLVVKRGQLKTGRDILARETGLSCQQVRTALNKLKSTSELTIKTTSKYSVITITYYDKYQDVNQQPNQQVTNEQPTSNQQSTTNNNDNNINNDNNKELFDVFWNLYGIKKSRAKCEAKYKALLKKGIEPDLILEGVKKYQSHCIAKQTQEQYIKQPLTFLNGSCWNDEYNNNQSNTGNRDESSSNSKHDAINRGIAAALQEIDDKPDGGLEWGM